MDESIITFKGRTTMMQYMPQKPHKWGLKAWALCESKSGYVYNWGLYTGRKAGGVEVGLAHAVVMEMCRPILENRHHVYMDNFLVLISLKIWPQRIQGRVAHCASTVAAHQTLSKRPNKFRMAVIHGLVSATGRRTPAPNTYAVCEAPTRLTGRHFPGNNPGRTPKGKQVYPDCVVCSDRTKKRHQSTSVRNVAFLCTCTPASSVTTPCSATKLRAQRRCMLNSSFPNYTYVQRI